MLDAEGTVTEWTEGARRVKGYSAEEVIGRHFSMFYTPEEIASGEPERLLEQAAREGRAEREAWRVYKDGGRIWANEVVTAVRDAEGRLMGFTKISRDLTERRALEQERVKVRAAELTALAEASERERISRELHDRVAHRMGVVHQSLELFAALRDTAPERAAEKLDLARRTTMQALDQTRNLSAELKSLQEEELEGGIEAAFGKLAESYVPDGMEMDVSFSGEESALPNPVGTQVYLAMREAIRNAVKHAGCSRIGVALEVRDGHVHGLVEDDGEGFDPEAVEEATPSWGLGLGSMRERLEMLGGSLRVDSEPGAGTKLELRVPLDERQP
jgi:PAS domain S-box-containing protein